MSQDEQRAHDFARRFARRILRHRGIILECEDLTPLAEKYHGQTVFDGHEMMGAELLAVEQMQELFTDIVKELSESEYQRGYEAGLEAAAQECSKRFVDDGRLGAKVYCADLAFVIRALPRKG